MSRTHHLRRRKRSGRYARLSSNGTERRRKRWNRTIRKSIRSGERFVARRAAWQEVEEA